MSKLLHNQQEDTVETLNRVINTLFKYIMFTG